MLPETLLEDFFVKMRQITIKYNRAIREKLIDKQAALNRAIGELSLLIDNDTNTQRVADLEQKLQTMSNEILHDEAFIHRNFHLLNDCKITPADLNHEKRKAGYSNICKITTDKGIITDPNKIRDETAKLYQKIYNKQEVNASVDDIKNFYNLTMTTYHWRH